jgi:histidyl-tRNA synthetase
MTPSEGQPHPRASESKVALVKGTADVLPDEFDSLLEIESLLLDRFARAGYRRVRVPVLEGRSLHERKSGARIVSHMYQVSGSLNEEVCLRPEVTAGIVRAYNDLSEPPPLPWRVSYSGPVFRLLPTGPGVLREFHQVGVERLDEAGNGGDAEAIWLADWSLAEAGIADATIRIGHAGLIRELLRWSGLPLGVQVALVEVLGEAAGGGDDASPEARVLSAAEAHLETLDAWLGGHSDDDMPVPDDDGGVVRLFRTLHPEVVGRRSSRDILGRIRRKWELGRGLSGVLSTVRERVRELSDLRGPALNVLDRLLRYQDVVPSVTGELVALVDGLGAYGVDPDRVELDLGFGRGIGFYSQMLFVLMAETPGGPFEVCGGGRYDGLARALGSPRDVRGVGFAFGLERLRDVLDARGQLQKTPSGRDVILLLADGTETYGLAAWLRAKGWSVVVDLASRGDDDVSADAARVRGFTRVIRPRSKGFRHLDVATGVSTDLASRDDLLRLLPGARP